MQSNTFIQTIGHRTGLRTTNEDACRPYRYRRGSWLTTVKEDNQVYPIPEEDDTSEIPIVNDVFTRHHKPTKNLELQMTRHRLVQI